MRQISPTQKICLTVYQIYLASLTVYQTEIHLNTDAVIDNWRTDSSFMSLKAGLALCFVTRSSAVTQLFHKICSLTVYQIYINFLFNIVYLNSCVLLFIIINMAQDIPRPYFSPSANRPSSYKYQYANGNNIRKGDIVMKGDDYFSVLMGGGGERIDPLIRVVDVHTRAQLLNKVSEFTLKCGEDFEECGCIYHKKAATIELSGPFHANAQAHEGLINTNPQEEVSL